MLRRLLQPNMVRRSLAVGIGGGKTVSLGFSVASGARAISASTLDATTVVVYFSACVTVVTVDDVQLQIDGGTWEPATEVTGSPGTVLTFTVPTIAAGDVVNIRGLAGALTNCETPSEDIEAWVLPVANNEEIDGAFMLLESGGSDIFLLEDAAADDGIELEDSA